jgi:hypothetical protein
VPVLTWITDDDDTPAPARRGASSLDSGGLGGHSSVAVTVRVPGPVTVSESGSYWKLKLSTAMVTVTVASVGHRRLVRVVPGPAVTVAAGKRL